MLFDCFFVKTFDSLGVTHCVLAPRIFKKYRRHSVLTSYFLAWCWLYFSLLLKIFTIPYQHKVSYGFAPSVTNCGDKGLIANELLERHQYENKSKNPIVGCKDREKSFRKKIGHFFQKKREQRLFCLRETKKQIWCFAISAFWGFDLSLV